MDCPLCIEKYGVRNRRVSCKFCNYELCVKCARQHILQHPLNPECASCNRSWPRAHLNEILTQTFVKTELRNARQNALLDLEKARLPEAQRDVEIINERKQFNRQIAELNRQIDELRRQRDNLGQGKQETKTVLQFHCPAPDCRGFVGANWKCGVCEQYSCAKCGILKSGRKDEHICNPDDVQSLELLRKDTKNCPKCHVPIFRSEGCPQMWCTQCQTAFHWKTLAIITTRIHNPHFFEYQQNGNRLRRDVQDLQCGGVMDLETFTQLFNSKWIGETSGRRVIREPYNEYIRTGLHFEDLLRESYLPTPDEKRHKLRVAYLMNEIDEEKWKRDLQLMDNKDSRNQEIRHLLQMYVTCIGDIFRNLETTDLFTWNDTALNELKNLETYVETHMAEIYKTYNSVYHGLNRM